MSERVPPSACAQCGSVHDRATDAYGTATARPGDLSVCIECGAAHQFDDELRLVTLTPAEFGALDTESRTELRKAQRAVLMLQRRPG